MRHFRSVLYALVLAPAVWVLVAGGLTHGSTTGLLLLMLGGAAYGVLAFAPISPLGPAVAGVAFLAVGGWAIEDAPGYATAWPLWSGLDLSRPGYGAAALLSVPLLMTVLRMRRRRGYQPVAWPFAGQRRPAGGDESERTTLLRLLEGPGERTTLLRRPGAAAIAREPGDDGHPAAAGEVHAEGPTGELRASTAEDVRTEPPAEGVHAEQPAEETAAEPDTDEPPMEPATDEPAAGEIRAADPSTGGESTTAVADDGLDGTAVEAPLDAAAESDAGLAAPDAAEAGSGAASGLVPVLVSASVTDAPVAGEPGGEAGEQPAVGVATLMRAAESAGDGEATYLIVAEDGEETQQLGFTPGSAEPGDRTVVMRPAGRIPGEATQVLGAPGEETTVIPRRGADHTQLLRRPDDGERTQLLGLRRAVPPTEPETPVTEPPAKPDAEPEAPPTEQDTQPVPLSDEPAGGEAAPGMRNGRRAPDRGEPIAEDESPDLAEDPTGRMQRPEQPAESMTVMSTERPPEIPAPRRSPESEG